MLDPNFETQKTPKTGPTYSKIMFYLFQLVIENFCGNSRYSVYQKTQITKRMRGSDSVVPVRFVRFLKKAHIGVYKSIKIFVCGT